MRRGATTDEPRLTLPTEHFALGELARGSHRFRILNVNGTIDTPGQIQWFGRYLAVGDNEQSVIDHVPIEGSTASIAGTTAVEHTSLYGFWIQNGITS
jgi:hypothetical protein